MKTEKQYHYQLSAFASSLLIGLLCLCSAVDAAEIHLREQISMTNPIVRLGDVAEIKASDPQQVNRLQQVMLIPSPSVGGEIRLDYATIRSKLQAQGLNLAGLEFSGHNRITITAAQPPQTLKAAAVKPAKQKPLNSAELKSLRTLLVQIISNFIRQNHPQFGEPVIALQLDTNKMTLLHRQMQHGYQIVAIKSLSPSEQAVIIRIPSESGQQLDVPIHCQILQKPKLLAVRYDLPRGHIINQEDLMWIHSERAATEPAMQPEDVIGQQTQKPLSKGNPLRSNDVKGIALVKTGQLVSVTANAGGISVRTEMKARSSGALGEMVTLIPLKGREKVLARVTGPKQAVIINSPAGNTKPEIILKERPATTRTAAAQQNMIGPVQNNRSFQSRNQNFTHIPNKQSIRNQIR